MSPHEDLRVSEFYKYHIADQCVRQAPNDGCAVQINQVVSPDTALTAFCQLAAIRLGVQRCGISLLSRYQQYILAEATRTTSLVNSQLSDDPEDALWLGMSECEREGGLCEITIELPPARETDVPSCFTVLDLQDSRFSEAPYVTGGPLARFYCGTPITTSNGLNIGSFWALDGGLRHEFTAAQKKFFATVASLVMDQLGTTKESSERQKSMGMGKALSEFVDGKLPLTYTQVSKASDIARAARRSLTDHTGFLGSNQNGYLDKAGVNMDFSALSPKRQRRPSHSISPLENGSGASVAFSDTTNMPTPEISQDRGNTFARASFFIRDALEATGCLFLDTAFGALAGLDGVARTDRSSSADDVLSASSPKTPTASFPDHLTARGKKRITPGLLAATANPEIPLGEVLGFCVGNRSSLAGDSIKEESGFTPMDEEFLLELVSMYPSGTLWTFEEMGTLFPEQHNTPPLFKRPDGSRRIATRTRRQAEAHLLRQYFPGVRQLLFVPLFDNALGHLTAGCFAFSDRGFRVFTSESDLPFMRAFINNVGAEISRLDASQLSSSKSDFIGSISHELRSPLHGVLAACEFLEETNLDNYQKSLISTQVSCGKTLLQVIENVLDYSKINSFEKDERTARRNDSDISSDDTAFGSKLQNLFEQTDLCELAEEVVEGSVAGKAHLSSTIGLPSPKSEESSEHAVSNGNAVYGFMKNVAVILDFEYQKDWIYVVQPGALRRILMNILGNSLKYTANGCIRVRIGVSSPTTPGAASGENICLSVSDTGKGISREFLRKRLFAPFNQEDHLSTGCGLGLSIVKSLVASLNGTLEVRSEQNVGTTVSVNFPLFRGSHSGPNDDPTPLPCVGNGPKLHLPKPPPDTTIGYVGFIVPEAIERSTEGQREGRIKESIKASVSTCMIDWLRMKPIDEKANIETADYVVILVDERLSDFIQPYVDDLEKKQPRVLALLSSETSRRGVEATLGKTIKAFEVISAPFGPRKMARAVAACEQTAASWSSARSTPLPSNVDPLHKVGADLELGSDLLQAEGLTRANPKGRGDMITRIKSTLAPHIPSPSLRPAFQHAGNGMRFLGTNASAKTTSDDITKSPASIEETTDTGAVEEISRRNPPSRLLLVDDNQINLRFLETFVKKRRPNHKYDCAEDGLQAVEAAKRNEDGFSIIFMDVSMPVMDGLEATRRIRALEQERHDRLGDTAPTPALIVALTGLASSRDQTSAFASGVNLFMTKPVKFKDIGKLLDENLKS